MFVLHSQIMCTTHQLSPAQLNRPSRPHQLTPSLQRHAAPQEAPLANGCAFQRLSHLLEDLLKAMHLESPESSTRWDASNLMYNICSTPIAA